ncbi:Uncharacterised protein [Vibrio cholerae]|nr:Uncharacterised protein [Vibrio cholerae]
MTISSVCSNASSKRTIWMINSGRHAKSRGGSTIKKMKDCARRTSTPLIRLLKLISSCTPLTKKRAIAPAWSISPKFCCAP